MSPDTAHFLFALWFLAMGGAIGSFLNVVVWRLPAGMSIVHPGSHCPLCRHAIRWYDNLPVLGWILLGGRCRDCRGPIAIRYPLVEAATAVMFLALGRCTFVSCSAVITSPSASLGVLVGGYVLALALLCTLLAAALMAYDGHQPPWRLYVPVLIAGIIAPACWPELHPVPFWSGRVRDMWTGVLDNLAVLTMVFLTVAIARVVLWLTKWTAALPPAHRGTLVATTCVGLCLGCQSLFVLVPVAAAAYALGRLASRRIPALGRISPVAWLGLATLLFLLDCGGVATGLYNLLGMAHVMTKLAP